MYQHKDLHNCQIDKPYHLYILRDLNTQLDDNKLVDFLNDRMGKNILDGRQLFLDTLHSFRRDFESIPGL